MATTKKRDAIKEFNFTWEGKDKSGKAVKGEMKAVGEAVVNATLRRQGILVEGGTSLRELNRKLSLSLPLDGPKTLNGLILEYLQEIPEAGVWVKIANTAMEIVQTQDRTIKTVRLFKAPSEENPPPRGTASVR